MHLLIFLVYKGNQEGRFMNLGFFVRYAEKYLEQTTFLKFENIII